MKENDHVPAERFSFSGGDAAYSIYRRIVRALCVQRIHVKPLHSWIVSRSIRGKAKVRISGDYWSDAFFECHEALLMIAFGSSITSCSTSGSGVLA